MNHPVDETLLLLTKYFPFNNGECPAESYLEQELPLLSEAFKSIVVVACDADKGASIIQDIPQNTKAIALGCGMSKTSKLFLCLSSCTIGAFGSELERAAANSERDLRIGEHLFQRYLVKKSHLEYCIVCDVLKSEKITPDYIYSFWFFDTALLGVFLRQEFSSKRLISRAHGYDLYAYRNRLNYLPLREYLLTNCDFVMPCSHDGRDYLASAYPVFQEKIVSLYLGTRDLIDRSHDRDANSGESFRILSCSRIVPVKRVEKIALALRILDEKTDFPIQWIHYGDGRDLPQIASRCQKLNKVTACFPGFISNADLLDQYETEHFDLFVNVSSSEGLPISIMEACGIGLPVIATDVGGVSEIVHNGENGYLLKKDFSDEELADAIYTFIQTDASRRQEMRNASRRIWEQSFCASNSVKALLALLFKEHIKD